MKKRIIFHIDVNSAFLSWTAVEILKKDKFLDIRTFPSVIAGSENSRRGVVLASSILAKQKGIKTGEPLYLAKRKYQDLKVYPPDHKLYKKKSDELHKYFLTISPQVEKLSIDEGFIDMTGTSLLYKDILKKAYEIKDYIENNFGYTVNIGIGNNKLTAKMASDFEKPNKVHTLYEEEIKDKLWPLPIEKLYSVGKVSSKKLRDINVNTIGDLANYNLKDLQRIFKNQAKDLIDKANGIDHSIVGEYEAKNKSISSSKTLMIDTIDSKELLNILLEQTMEVGKQLRKEEYYANVVGIVIRYKNFDTFTFQKKINIPTNVDKELFKVVQELFKQSWNKDYIRLIGVRVMNLTKERIKQMDLFAEKETVDSVKLQKTLDDIQEKYGSKIITIAKLKEPKNKR